MIRGHFAKRVERINYTKQNNPQRPTPPGRLPKEGHHEHIANVQQHFGWQMGSADILLTKAPGISICGGAVIRV